MLIPGINEADYTALNPGSEIRNLMRFHSFQIIQYTLRFFAITTKSVCVQLARVWAIKSGSQSEARNGADPSFTK